MKVKELIERLSKFDEELTVYIDDTSTTICNEPISEIKDIYNVTDFYLFIETKKIEL